MVDCRHDGAVFIARDPGHFEHMLRKLRVPCCRTMRHVHPIMRLWALPEDLRAWAVPGTVERIRELGSPGQQGAPSPAQQRPGGQFVARLEPQPPIICGHGVNVRQWRCPFCEGAP